MMETVCVCVFSSFTSCPLDGKWVKRESTTGCHWLPVTVSSPMELCKYVKSGNIVLAATPPYERVLCALTCSGCVAFSDGATVSDHTWEDTGDWVTHRPVCCAAKERPGLLCFPSPPEASWPRIISGTKFAFWGCWKVADTSSYIEDGSFITLLSLSSPNSVPSLLCCLTFLKSLWCFLLFFVS